MASRNKVALVGAGRMGSAMAAGWLGAERNALPPEDLILVCPRVSDSARPLVDRYNLKVVETLDAKTAAEVGRVVVAVKPQVFPKIAPALSEVVREDALIISVLAGTGLTVVAATLGATAIFLAARSSLGAGLERRLQGRGGFLARLRAGVAENEVSVLLTLRLIPAVPFFIANLAPAFLGVRTRTYIWTTFVGIIPGTAVYSWTGAGLGAVFDAGGEPDLGLIFRIEVLGPLLALAALAALPAVLRAVRGRRASLEGEA